MAKKSKQYIKFVVDQPITLMLVGKFRSVKKKFRRIRFMRYECSAKTDSEGNTLSIGLGTRDRIQDLIDLGHPPDGQYSIVRTGCGIYTQYFVTAISTPG